MHKKAYKMMEKLCEKIEAIGVDNMTPEQVEEAKCWSAIANNMAQLDYNYKIIDEMEKSEYGEDYDENGPLRGFSSRMHPRSSRTGRFVERNYTEPMHDKMPMEVYYDGDRYYTSGGSNSSGSNMSGGRMNYNSADMVRDAREGKFGMSRRHYMESKEMNESKDKQMQKLDKALTDMKSDLKGMIVGADKDTRMYLKQELMKYADSIPQQ